MVFLCGFVGAWATQIPYVDRGTGPIVLDEVECTGVAESSLLECDHNGIGHHYCDYSEFAGVICQGNTINFYFLYTPSSKTNGS